MAKRFWLMKSEPEVFSFDDLKKAPAQTSRWDGVRNYEARNFLRDQVQVGDAVFFYHSSSKVPAIAGIATVARAAYPDPAQFDKESPYFDPAATPEAPRWFSVDLRYERPLPRPVSLPELKADPELRHMVLLTRGRLSVQPVRPSEWRAIESIAKRAPKKSNHAAGG